MTFSKANNPLAKDQLSIFIKGSALVQLYIIAGIVFIFALSRIVYDIKTKKERRTRPKLLYGFLLLAIAYILGGLFSPMYNLKTIIFGLIQIIALSFTYFCFYYTVDWKKVNKDYFAFLFTGIGFLMVAEIGNMLIDANILNYGKSFSRSKLYTGWGHYNNIASVIIFCIPAPFYFATTRNNGWKYILIATLFLSFILLNQSRNGMLFGTIIYIISAIATVVLSKKAERTKSIITLLILLILAYIITVIFRVKIQEIFASIYKAGADDAGRFEIYRAGFKHYTEYPIFGQGFYRCDSFRWGIPYTADSFLPPRYHDTYIQILASCGTIGIIAYLYHRYETLKLFFMSKSISNIFIFIMLMGFIMISVLDCHFHNFGPGFLYSALLILAEKVNTKEAQ
jgi:hypothetical protein